MADLSIGEVSRRAGVSASAIRYYERRGLLPPPPRRSGRRCYDRNVVRRLKLIRELRRCGKSIRDLKDWKEAVTERRDTRALRKLLESEIGMIELRLATLTTLKLELTTKLACECTSLNDCTAL